MGIAGPGDALAEWETAAAAIRLVRAADPEIIFCLSTNGLELPERAEELAALGVSHLSVTINALDPRAGKRIYQYVDYRGVRYRGEEAAALLLERQMRGLRLAAKAGLVCKVNIVFLKGINGDEIPSIVKAAKNAGAAMTNIMRFIPVEESLFYGIPAASEEELAALRKNCAAILPQMYHCRQCRADAIGTLEHDISSRWTGDPEAGKTARGENTAPRLFAAASSGGVLVDEHFGRVSAFYVYEYSGGEVRFRERREVGRFCGETGGCGRHERLGAALAALEDCEAVLAAMIGEAPKLELEKRGVAAYVSYDSIENAVRRAADRKIQNCPETTASEQIPPKL